MSFNGKTWVDAPEGYEIGDPVPGDATALDADALNDLEARIAAAFAGAGKTSIVGARALVGVRLGGMGGVGGWSLGQQRFGASRIELVQDHKGIEFLVGGPLLADAAAPNDIIVSVGVEVAGTLHVLTIDNRASCRMDGNGCRLTDELAGDFVAGQVLLVRQTVDTPFGTARTLNAAMAATGLTSFTSASLPNLATFNMPQAITLDAGGSEEVVTVNAILDNAGAPAVTGSTGPYTYKLAGATTKTHASGASFGQKFPATGTLWSDLGESASATDLSQSGVVGASPSPSATTVAAPGANAGERMIPLANVVRGDQLTLNSGGGTQETVGLLEIVGESAPYRAYLAGPLANTHASPEPAIGNIGNAAGQIPIAAVSRHVKGARKKAVAIAGDSIPNGTGYNVRSPMSYVHGALYDQKIPYINLTKAGEAAFQFAVLATSRYRQLLAEICDHFHDEYGTNDVYSGQTHAQLAAIKLARANICATLGIRYTASTIPPRANDVTNTPPFSAANGAGQTVATGDSGNRATHVTWMRDGAPVDPATKAAVATGTVGAIRCAVYGPDGQLFKAASGSGHPIWQIFDASATIEVVTAGPVFTGKIIVDPTTGFPITSSGLHFSKLGHDLIRAGYNAWITGPGQPFA